MFKYLGQILDRPYDDLSAVLRNIRKAQKVWGRLRKWPRREGEETAFLAKFYHAVYHAVLLFGADMWVVSAQTEQKLEGVHVGFLIQVSNSKANRLREGLWRKVETKTVLQGARTQPLQTYLGMRQETVLDCVALRPIFQCMYKGYGI